MKTFEALVDAEEIIDAGRRLGVIERQRKLDLPAPVMATVSSLSATPGAQRSISYPVHEPRVAGARPIEDKGMGGRLPAREVLMRQVKSQVEWRELVERFESSGATGKAFAARHGVNVRTLMWWRSYVRREARDRGTPAVRLVELRPVGAGARAGGADSRVSVFAGGMRIGVCPGFDPATLSAVLEVVEARARGAR